MEVILRQAVENLGHPGDVVTVSNGYARNYLLPRGLALLANNKNKAQLAHQMRQADKAKAQMVVEAQKDGERLSKMTLTFARRVGEQGKLFGSVTSSDIAEAIAAATGVTVDRRKIALDEPLKAVGPADVEVTLHSDVRITVTVEVVPS